MEVVKDEEQDQDDEEVMVEEEGEEVELVVKGDDQVMTKNSRKTQW